MYPGQTFDVAIPLDKAAGSPISQESLEAAVSEFHRRNEEARLIEARSQEPVVRGVRLLATGLVDQPAELVLDEQPARDPIGHRRVFTGEAWHDDVPVYDGDTLRPGAPDRRSRARPEPVHDHRPGRRRRGAHAAQRRRAH